MSLLCALPRMRAISKAVRPSLSRRDVSGAYRRRRSRSRSGDRRRRSRSRSTDRKREKKVEEPNDPALKPLTLKEIIAMNPGISLPEAAQKLNAHNTAIALAAASLSATISAATMPLMGLGSLVGEGGSATKSQRELCVLPTISYFTSTL